jgi:DNA uptake protein ComE-like DNA-binding protein
MKFLESHFWYNKNQRNGILFLILIILILQLVYVYTDFSSFNKLQVNSIDLDRFQNEIDSLKRIELESRKPKLYVFNPNYLTDFKGYQLGMRVEEIDRLITYRNTGKFVNTKLEFQHVTKVSDSLLQIISPFFKFPDWVNASNKDRSKYVAKKNDKVISGIEKKDLNRVTSHELQSINGIGEKLSKRIVAYRNMLQGFTENEQLYEVYYLEKEVANKVLLRFEVLTKPAITKVNINVATFKEILKVPYIDYALTKKIFDFRDELGDFSSLSELKKIDSFPLEKYDRITLYLTTEKMND